MGLGVPLGSLLLVHAGLVNAADHPSNVNGDPGSFPIVCPGTLSNEITVTARDPVLRRAHPSPWWSRDLNLTHKLLREGWFHDSTTMQGLRQ
jgi:hypothetical protein